MSSAHVPMTLNSIIAQTAIEAGDTLDPSHNRYERDRLIALINGAQQDLWDSWPWEGFDSQHDIAIVAQQNTYNIPATLDLGRTTSVGFRLNGLDEKFRPMEKGYDLFVSNVSDPDSRPSPGYEYDQLGTPRMFRVVNDGTQAKLELWPRPAAPGVLRFTGTIALRPLVADDDMSLLDGRMVALAAAAKLWSVRGGEDAMAVARHLRNQTNTRMNILRGRAAGAAGAHQPRVGLSRDEVKPLGVSRWRL